MSHQLVNWAFYHLQDILIFLQEIFANLCLAHQPIKWFKIFIIFLQEIFPTNRWTGLFATLGGCCGISTNKTICKIFIIMEIFAIFLQEIFICPLISHWCPVVNWALCHFRRLLWLFYKSICKIFIIFEIFPQEIFICPLIFCVSHWCPVNWALCHFRRLLWLPLQPRAQFTATGVPLTLERGKKNFVSSNVWSKKQNEMVSHFVHIQRHVSRLEYYGRAAHAGRAKKKKNWRNVENRQN